MFPNINIKETFVARMNNRKHIIRCITPLFLVLVIFGHRASPDSHFCNFLYTHTLLIPYADSYAHFYAFYEYILSFFFMIIKY